jgi:sirohydrochlorin ferrochelatase
MKTAYVVFAHGSSVESANDAVRVVAAEMARRGGLETVVAAFLEGGQPDLSGALESLAGHVSRVVVVPYFLTLGLHLQRDLPRLIEKVKSAHPGLTIEVTAPLDQHPAMVEALLDRALAAS